MQATTDKKVLERMAQMRDQVGIKTAKGQLIFVTIGENPLWFTHSQRSN